MFRLPRSLDLLVAPILVPKHGMARPFTPRTSRLVACPEMWHHYVFDRAINTTGLSPAGSQNCRLLHLGGTLCQVEEALGAGLQIAAPPLVEPSLATAEGGADVLDSAAGETETDGGLTRREVVVHGVHRGTAASGCPRGTF